MDVITNSSTELFCIVKAKTEDEVHKIIYNILQECNCMALMEMALMESIDVYPHKDYENDGETVEGLYDIVYEQHTPPCKLILHKIKETFDVIREEKRRIQIASLKKFREKEFLKMVKNHRK